MIWLIRFWDENTSVKIWRQYTEDGAAKAPMPKGVEVVPVNIPGLPAGLAAEWLQPVVVATDDAVILYTHGGGYISGSCSDHRALVAKLVASTGLRLLLFEYRLAPEHPFPAALEDTLTAYRWLLTQIKPSTKVIIAGESAGGGLCLGALLALKDRAVQGETLKLPVAGVSISPLYGDLKGLPPLLLTVGTDEGLLDDSLDFAEKTKAAGVDIRLIVGEGQVHCYPLLPDFVPEAKYAMAEISEFIRANLRSTTIGER